LQLGNILEFIEVLLEFGIEVQKYLVILVEDFKKFILSDLISNGCGLLELTVLVAESLIESGDLDLIIIDERLLLLEDNLIKF
jgi:hypothetical protein